MDAAISAIEYFLPDKVVSTSDLSVEFPDWSVEKIDEKTGIQFRHVAGPEECASDLAVNAAEQLFASGACDRESIDFILLCTQSPDYFLPTTAWPRHTASSSTPGTGVFAPYLATPLQRHS